MAAVLHPASFPLEQDSSLASRHLHLVDTSSNEVQVAVGLGSPRVAEGAARPVRLPEEVYWARRAAVALAVALAVVASVLMLRTGADAVALDSPLVPLDAPIEYLVQPGDTIWSVARSLQPSGDVRPLVDQLTSANGGASLDVGQRLILQ
jgi:hypothetical protein